MSNNHPKYYKSIGGETFIKVIGDKSTEVYISHDGKRSKVEFDSEFGSAMFENSPIYISATPSEFMNAYRKHQENILDFINEAKRVDY